MTNVKSKIPEWKKTRLHEMHPKRDDLPNYGLVFESGEEARIRARAEKYEIDFDVLKAEFEMSHQVISAEYDKRKKSSLIKERIVPSNAAVPYFEGMLNMSVLSKTHPTFQYTPKVQ